MEMRAQYKILFVIALSFNKGRDYFAGLKVTKRNKATVLLTLSLLQTPTLTLTLIPDLYLHYNIPYIISRD